MSSETERGRTAEVESLWEGTARDRKADLVPAKLKETHEPHAAHVGPGLLGLVRTHTRFFFSLFFKKAFCSASRLQKKKSPYTPVVF